MKNLRQYFGGFGNRLFQLAYIYAGWRDKVLPDIYLQDFRYFDKYRDELKQIFGGDAPKSDFVSLHIRRGDYVDNPFYVDLTKTDYYRRAVEKFPDSKFLVFCADRQEGSNDVEDRIWVHEYLRNFITKDRVFYHTGKDEVEDFNKMAGCKGHIMANSSFSFWASYVGGGETVAPKRWFSDGRTIPLPEEFIQI